MVTWIDFPVFWFTTRTTRPIELNDTIPLDGSVSFDTEVPIYD